MSSAFTAADRNHVSCRNTMNSCTPGYSQRLPGRRSASIDPDAPSPVIATTTPPETDGFRGRWNEPGIVSYAQNAEDVRLWRVFSTKPGGFYVDVGAGDPVLHSVTKLFYDAGWSGLNIEPGPMYAALVEARPRDVNLDIAVSTEEGQADFWISSPDSGLSSFVAPDAELVPDGFSFEKTQVRCARLDKLIEEHAAGREIDFLKIDVEGAEGDVLRSFDAGEIRPTVILVEAISPIENRRNHEEWESLIVEHGYVFAAFDGINRFYVTAERSELVDALAYPMSVLDKYEPTDAVGARFREHQALQQRAAEHAQENATLSTELRQLEETNQRLTDLRELAATNIALAARDSGTAHQLKALQQTVSWRITRPLRSVRRAQLRWFAGASRHRTLEKPRVDRSIPVVHDLERAFARRLSQAAGALDPASLAAPTPDLVDALDALESALRRATTVPDRAKAWISIVAAEGSYPGERSVERVARRLRMEGAAAVRSELVSRFEYVLEQGSATTAEFDVRRDRVVVDVTHTVSNSLHTGIQRVVRETVSRWIEAGFPVDLVHFDFLGESPRLLAQTEYERLRWWREHLGRSGAEMSSRLPEEASGNLLIPWQCQFVVPELAAEPERCAAYRVLASSSVLRSLSLVGYDLIPMIAAYAVADGMPGAFADYLSIMKHADRISAISRTSADGFRAFGEMTASEGLRRPEVAPHELAIEATVLAPERIAEARKTLGVGTRPVVLVVGSHEPRKNHLAVLESAERLWARGESFELLFIGGSGWKSEEFDELVDSLASIGRPIRVRKRCTEQELWAAYSLARFTVFPSILEGFGLPVAESLASGTPAITSGHGSMAEIAEGGGCLVVDPRDVDSLGDAMSRLLTDDSLFDRLRLEAAARPTRTWDEYAEELWGFLVESNAP